MIPKKVPVKGMTILPGILGMARGKTAGINTKKKNLTGKKMGFRTISSRKKTGSCPLTEGFWIPPNIMRKGMNRKKRGRIVAGDMDPIKNYKKTSGKDTDTSQPGKNYAGRQDGGPSTSHTGQQGGSVSRRSAFSEEQRDYEEKMHRKPAFDPKIPRPDEGILKPGKDKDGNSGNKGAIQG